jgi:hypothetical protein
VTHKDPEAAKAYQREYARKNAARKKAYREAHKDEIKARMSAYGKENRARRYAYLKEWRAKHPDKMRAIDRRYRNANKAQISAKKNAYVAIKVRTDPQFKLRRLLRCRLNDALNSNYKTGSSVKLLGCSVPALVLWLEAKFTPEMTWDNHGPVWHIDHKRPLAAFDLSDPLQLAAACHYTNLQPMLALDNLQKGSVIIGDNIPFEKAPSRGLFFMVE